MYAPSHELGLLSTVILMFVTLYADHYVAVLILRSMILGTSETRNNLQSCKLISVLRLHQMKEKRDHNWINFTFSLIGFFC